MDEEITTRIEEHRSFRGFVIWLAIVGGIAVLTPIAWGLWLVRQYLPVLGYIWLGSLTALPAILLAWGLLALVRFATRADYRSISEHGTYVRDVLGRGMHLAPLGAAPARTNTKTGKVEVNLAVPSLFDLIENGDIARGNTDMIMGYDKAQLSKGVLQLVAGAWPGTHAIAGKGRSGKTRRVIGEVSQALISGAKVTICDPHFTKADSLAHALEPLEKYLTIARGEAEIIQASNEFLSEMESRVSEPDRACFPWVIIYDEWSRLMDDNNAKMPEGGRDVCIDVAKNCSTQYAGYMGYCCVIGQIWTQEAVGGTEIRRSLQAVFVHQLSAEYAAFFFRPAKWRNRAEELKRRECIYRDTDGQVRDIVTVGVPDDTAIRVASWLANNGIPEIEAPAREPFTIHHSPLPQFSRLQLLPAREEENTVNEPVRPREGTVNAVNESEYSPQEEAAVLHVAWKMLEEERKVTRTGIRDALGWNNKQYKKIQMICDKHGIATAKEANA